MRIRIYERLQEIKNYHNGFSPKSMRWGNRTFKGVLLNDIPLGDYEFMDSYTDSELLELLEMLVRQMNKQM